jgi:hypothetical protein
MQKFLFTKLSNDCTDAACLADYLDLITKALIENRVKLERQDSNYIYYEGHHILPRSLYPDFAKEPLNIVLLTAREHYLAHKYLASMFPHTNLVFAFWRLSTDGRGRYVSIDDYETARLLVAEKTKLMNTGREVSKETREKYRHARLGYKHPETVKLKISESHKGKKATEETKLKLSKAKLGKPAHIWTEESRKKLADKRVGDKNPMYGKNIKDYMTSEAYDAYKNKLSESLMGHEVSDETRRKIGENSALRCNGAGNPRARRVLCIEDNIIFGTITECGQYYGHSRRWANDTVKAGYSKTLNKHFKFLEKETE